MTDSKLHAWIAESRLFATVSPFLEEARAWFDLHPIAGAALGLLVLGGLSWLAYGVTRRVFLPILSSMIRRTPTGLDDALWERKTFERMAWAVPLLVFHQGLPFFQSVPTGLATLLTRLSVALIILVAVRAFAAAVAAINDVYIRLPQAKNRPIKGYLQVANVIAHFVAAIFIVAALIDRSPVILLSGLGAMTAILLLVFRDTLLSLVAGVQITTNELIRVGDWIEMPQFQADGDVVDIALNTISVQNWDKTITVIPTHKFLEHSFKNWEGMRRSGGRRIKRAVHLDVSTVRFLTEEEVDRFENFSLLRDYIRQKRAELEAHNRSIDDPSLTVNTRRLTNLGTFRAYVTNYLRQHPGVHQDMTFLVRQLQPTAEGLPLEIYVFANDVRWAVYEGIQADIFDHIFAIIPAFGLRAFQSPSGNDFVRAFGLEERLEPAGRAVLDPAGEEKIRGAG